MEAFVLLVFLFRFFFSSWYKLRRRTSVFLGLNRCGDGSSLSSLLLSLMGLKDGHSLVHLIRETQSSLRSFSDKEKSNGDETNTAVIEGCEH